MWRIFAIMALLGLFMTTFVIYVIIRQPFLNSDDGRQENKRKKCLGFANTRNK